MNSLPRRLGGMLVAVCVVADGCDTSSPSLPTAHLEGMVRLDGEPLASGRIHFMPAAETPGVPVTAEIAAGHYEADDVPLGAVVVTFTAVKATGEIIREAEREPYPELVSIIPAHYAAGIPLQVVGDNAEQNFDLTNSAPK